MERSYSQSPTKAPVERPLRWLAWALCALSLALIAAALALALAGGRSFYTQLYFASVAASALVGGLVAARRPENPVGWLFLGSALCYGLFAAAVEYATGAAARSAPPLLLLLASWLSGILVALGVGLPLTILPHYFPTGHLLGPRWRPLALGAAAYLAAAALYNAVRPGPLQRTPELDNPLGLALLRPLVPALDALNMLLLLATLIGGGVTIAARYWRSRGVERQQLKWLTFAVIAWVALVLLSALLSALRPEWYEIPALELLIGLAFTGIPVAAGVAVLRYRLYAIDTLISRTLVYGVLTAAVVAIYALVVGYLSALFPSGGNFYITVAATGVVAVAFQPLRAALQRAVNRLLYGRRDDPQAVIASLGRRLEGAVAADAVLPTIVATVARELKLPYAAIVLDDDRGAAAASVGSPVAPTLALPIVHGGSPDEAKPLRPLGQLIVAARGPDEPFTPGERRVLDELARQAGAAVHAARLAEELQQSRERLVLAREEERRRLRNDLHDGLGPQLAALALKLETARNRLAHEPQAQELFADLIRRTQATISDVRRVVYALRPPALDELGLRSALQEWVARYPQGDPGGPQIGLSLPDRLPPLPAAVEVAVYRIAQEAVTNVVRHAGATRCAIALALDEIAGRLSLTVEDDGRGIAAGQAAGVGLSSMRERAAELGGSLAVARGASGGTIVRVELPF